MYSVWHCACDKKGLKITPRSLVPLSPSPIRIVKLANLRQSFAAIQELGHDLSVHSPPQVVLGEEISTSKGIV